MTQTPNFQLNQWSPEDYVRRTDFNADNTRVDRALSRNKIEKLTEVVTTEATPEITVLLPGDDWSEYLELKVVFQMGNSGNSIYVRLNDLDTQTYYSLTSNSNTSSKATHLLQLPPAGGGISGEGCLMPFGMEGTVCAQFQTVAVSGADFWEWPAYGLAPIEFAALEKIKFVTEGTFRAGSQVAVYGVLR